MSATHLQFSEF